MFDDVIPTADKSLHFEVFAIMLLFTIGSRCPAIGNKIQYQYASRCYGSFTQIACYILQEILRRRFNQQSSKHQRNTSDSVKQHEVLVVFVSFAILLRI